MIQTVRVDGAVLTDEIFSIDRPGFPEISWNITKILRDAKAGVFGPPERIAMSRLPPMTEYERGNIDWDKVRSMTDSPIVHEPAAQVIFEHNGQLHRMPIDGNHRICARQARGMDYFESYVVPEEMERRYRVTIALHSDGLPLNAGEGEI